MVGSDFDTAFGIIHSDPLADAGARIGMMCVYSVANSFFNQPDPRACRSWSGGGSGPRECARSRSFDSRTHRGPYVGACSDFYSVGYARPWRSTLPTFLFSALLLLPVYDPRGPAVREPASNGRGGVKVDLPADAPGGPRCRAYLSSQCLVVWVCGRRWLLHLRRPSARGSELGGVADGIVRCGRDCRIGGGCRALRNGARGNC